MLSAVTAIARALAALVTMFGTLLRVRREHRLATREAAARAYAKLARAVAARARTRNGRADGGADDARRLPDDRYRRD